MTRARSDINPALLALLATGYFIAAKLGLKLAFVNASATAVWPPTGIALGMLLILGYRVWPWIFLGAFLANVTTAGSIATSIGIAAGNTLEGLVGTYLVNRFANGRDVFDRVQDIFKFIVLAGLISTVVSATIGVTSLSLGGYALWANYGSIWLTWWLGDVGGALIVTPLLVLWKRDPGVRWDRAKIMEAILLFLLLSLVGRVVFGASMPWHDPGYSMKFLYLPFLIWAAFRFSQREVAAFIVILSGMTIGSTLHTGFLATESANTSLLILQMFLAVTGMTTLVLSAVVGERARAQAALQGARDALKKQVEERTAKLTETNEALRMEIAERKQVEQQLIQAAKLESVGRLAAGIAHEVKNPLAIILQGLDYLSKHLDLKDGDGKAPLVLKYTSDAVRRADMVVRELLDFSATRELALTPGDLNRVVEQALRLVKHALDRSHLTVIKALDEQLPQVRVDQNKLEQVFVNVLMNAIYAMPEGGTLTVRTSTKQLTNIDYDVGTREHDRFKIGETVVITEVDDTGTGIPEEIIQKIFDPFFTTKPNGKGTGLGLTVTHKIVDLHGGIITVRNRSEGGVRVTVLLRAEM